MKRQVEFFFAQAWRIFVFISIFSFISFNAFCSSKVPATEDSKARMLADCEPGHSSAEMNINNVRYTLNMSGSIWWDTFSSARYEIPVGSGCNSLTAGSFWIGGKDAANQIKVAAMTYGQSGNDFWPGPITVEGGDIASVSQDVCNEYDRFFEITRLEVSEFREWWACTQNPNCDVEDEFPTYVIPQIILNWPAHGPLGGYAYNLAPWWDNDGDGNYNPLQGDFPYFEFTEQGISNDPLCKRPRGQQQRLFGDKSIWWVFNDKGGEHTETGGEAIGLEVRAQSFAFSTGDAVNDMSFYNYCIINRSPNALNDTYVGFWTEACIGNSQDDYIGCDVQRGLGYCYNGDDNDESSYGVNSYGEQPPAVGIDFFEGPYQDPDELDNSTSYDTINNQLVLNCSKGDILNGNINGLNFQDNCIDNERWGMTRFMSYNCCGSPAMDHPSEATDYYNYLRAYWLDNTSLCYGGIGHGIGGGDINTPTQFIFPGSPTTDPCGWGSEGAPQLGWSEESIGAATGTNVFIISSGPFTMEAGEVNDITMGVVWARAASGGAWASVEALKSADDMAQQLFENCFRVIEGPDAPELEIIELDSSLIFHIYNTPNSNNYLESYMMLDPYLICPDTTVMCSQYYKFQGYQVFQLKNQNLTIADRYDESLVKQAFQCDVKDNISKVINFNWSDEHKADIPVIEVEGNNNGITRSFVIDKDLFTENSDNLVNNREYYFTVIAYGYNHSLLYNQEDVSTLNAQKKPYLAGENNIKIYKATPHSNNPQNGGTILNTSYGFQPAITMHEGHGNSNNIIELSDESIAEIMSGYPWKIDDRTYKSGNGPVTVKVIDPLNVYEDTYTLKLKDVSVNSYGVGGTNSAELTNDYYIPFNYTLYLSNGDSVSNDYGVLYGSENEQLFTDYGISISVSQNNFAGAKSRNDYQNGFLAAEMEFSDPTKPWLDFIKDGEKFDAENWIRVGKYRNGDLGNCADMSYDDLIVFDQNQYFENILGGSWAHYRFVNSGQNGISLGGARNFQNIIKFEPLSSVDLVITSDKSKWTKCCVVEMRDNEWEVDEDCPLLMKEVVPWVNNLSRGNAKKFALRSDPSVDKEGNVIPGDTTHGMSWFPGYAIDLRTGRRLNIVFGEDSWLVGDNGSDMMWNPSSGLYSNSGPVFGGKHVIYIMGDNQNYANSAFNAPKYDSCRFMYDNLRKYEISGIATTSLNRAWASAMWCAIPILNPEFEFLETDVKIKLRVSGPYHKGMNEFAVAEPENDNFPMFSFSTIGLKAELNDSEILSDAIDKINIVPNPYYWGNQYGQLNYDGYVRLINLPDVCIISIYSSSGGLVNRFNKNDSNNFYQWDMKDSYGKSIANGVYIIHIEIPGVGEKVIKWFGSTRV